MPGSSWPFFPSAAGAREGGAAWAGTAVGSISAAARPAPDSSRAAPRAGVLIGVPPSVPRP